MRVVHRILGTNVVLKQMGLTNSETCNMCNEHKDSVQHIFWQCAVTQQFLSLLVDLVNNKCQNAHNMRFSESLLLLGVKIDQVIYLILLLAKQYIYKCKI